MNIPADQLLKVNLSLASADIIIAEALRAGREEGADCVTSLCLH